MQFLFGQNGQNSSWLLISNRTKEQIKAIMYQCHGIFIITCMKNAKQKDNCVVPLAVTIIEHYAMLLTLVDTLNRTRDNYVKFDEQNMK